MTKNTSLALEIRAEWGEFLALKDTIFRLFQPKSDDYLFLYIKNWFSVHNNHLNLYGQLENSKRLF